MSVTTNRVHECIFQSILSHNVVGNPGAAAAHLMFHTISRQASYIENHYEVSLFGCTLTALNRKCNMLKLFRLSFADAILMH